MAMWAKSFKFYLSSIKQYRIIMKKIFTKNTLITQDDDFVNVYLDDTGERYYEKKLSNLMCFGFSNDNKENFLIEFK